MSAYPTSLTQAEIKNMTSTEIVHMAVRAQTSPFYRLEIKDADTIHTLGMDSLDKVELVIELEEAVGIKIADDEHDATLTVGDFINLVERKRGQA